MSTRSVHLELSAHRVDPRIGMIAGEGTHVEQHRSEAKGVALPPLVREAAVDTEPECAPHDNPERLRLLGRRPKAIYRRLDLD